MLLRGAPVWRAPSVILLAFSIAHRRMYVSEMDAPTTCSSVYRQRKSRASAQLSSKRNLPGLSHRTKMHVCARNQGSHHILQFSLSQQILDRVLSVTLLASSVAHRCMRISETYPSTTHKGINSNGKLLTFSFAHRRMLHTNLKDRCPYNFSKSSPSEQLAQRHAAHTSQCQIHPSGPHSSTRRHDSTSL